MASACCIHQGFSPPAASLLRHRGFLQSRPPWLGFAGLKAQNAGSRSGGRIMHGLVRASSAIVRTVAASPESEVGDSEQNEDKSSSEEAQITEEAQTTEEDAVKNDDDGDKTRRPKFKKKSLIHILETLHSQAIEQARKDREIPDIRPGYVVQIRTDAPETRRRVALLRGIVICRRNNGANTTITIRRMIAGVGVEIVIPLYSPVIKEITVLTKKKVRRAKLYYLRKKLAKFSTF